MTTGTRATNDEAGSVIRADRFDLEATLANGTATARRMDERYRAETWSRYSPRTASPS